MIRREWLRSWRTLAIMGLFAVALAFALVRLEDTRKDTARALAAQTRVTAQRLAAERDRSDAKLAHAVRRNCRSIEAVKQQARLTVQTSLKRLPSLTYYKEHPDELVAALAEARQSVKRFGPVNCKMLVP